jgi:hypothetical protein
LTHRDTGGVYVAILAGKPTPPSRWEGAHGSMARVPA